MGCFISCLTPTRSAYISNLFYFYSLFLSLVLRSVNFSFVFRLFAKFRTFFFFSISLRLHLNTPLLSKARSLLSLELGTYLNVG